MIKVVIATMVKDEEDIVKEWVEYYGEIFGYNNLYIIDNYSTDKTYEILKKYVSKGVCLNRVKKYKNKGDFMTLIKKNVECDFFIPVDIDEFLVLYDKNKNQVFCNNLLKYFDVITKKYPNQLLFKTEYIYPIKTNNCNKILKQFTHGRVNNNMKRFAKTFIQNKIKNYILIDHGNHIYTSNYVNTKLYLIHYTRRTDEQFKKKIINNVTGFNYEKNVSNLKNKVKSNPGLPGKHHVKHCIRLLENPDLDYTPKTELVDDSMVDLKNIIDFIYKK